MLERELLAKEKANAELAEALVKREKELKEAWEEAERLRLLVPTTAQAMVYMDLLRKYEKAQVACAEKDEALTLAVREICEHEAEYEYHTPDSVLFKLNKVLASPCGKNYVRIEDVKPLLEIVRVSYRPADKEKNAYAEFLAKHGDKLKERE